MGWAESYIAFLQQGTTVSFRPKGHSMAPKVCSGELVTVEPVQLDALSKGDIVLCKVKGKEYLHLVKAVNDGQVLIGNNRGRTNGWTSQVYGRLVKVHRDS
jgi:SOS-response transcriptional repressor LexA